MQRCNFHFLVIVLAACVSNEKILSDRNET